MIQNQFHSTQRTGRSTLNIRRSTGERSRKKSGVMDYKECQAISLICSHEIDKKVTLGYLELLVEIRKPLIQVDYDGHNRC
jgi:hypothetical protein